MKRILLLLISVFSVGIGFAQVTIAQQDFESLPAGPVMNYSGGSSATGTGLFPSGEDNFVSGSRGRKVTNSTTTILFDNVNTSTYSDVDFSVKLASFGGSSGNGADGSDYVIVEVSDDGGSTWTQQAEVNGTGNALWHFGQGSTESNIYNAGGYSTAVTGGDGSSGINEIIITDLPSVTNLRVRLLFKNNSSNETWIIDDAKIEGILATTDTELNFASTTYSVSEGDGTASICVDITNPSATPTTAYVVLTSANLPHVIYPTTGITFPASSSAQQCVTVNLTDNVNCSDATDYTFQLQSVSGGTSATAGADNETTLSVSDNDGINGVFKTLSFEGSDDWGYTGGGSVENDFNKYFGTNSYRIGGSNNLTTDNISLVGFSNVSLSVAFASVSADSNEDLYLEISYDNGSSWSGTGSIKLVDGYSNANINMGNTNGSNPTTVGTNPWIVNIDPSETQIKVRLRATSLDGSEYYYVDDIILSGESCSTPEPEINIQGNVTDIADGNTTISTTDDTDFGDVLVSSGTPVSHTFTIQNTGTANLDLTTITSSNTDFVVSTYTNPTTVTAGDSTTFVVTFTSTATGTSTGTITIASNDADENPYTFNVAGNGTAVPSIVLSSANPAVATTNLQADASIDNTVIYAFDLAVSVYDATLTAFDFVTSGTYAASNVTNFKVWYSSDATFSAGSDTQLELINTSLGSGSHSATGFSQSIASGSTGYIFITVDLPCGATNGNTIIVNAITPGDLTFTSGTATGTAYASATHTITEVAPNNVTALATANCENEGVDLSWTAATGCKDNYLVIASPTALTTTPTTGPTYTGNAAYGSGTAYDGGYIVYEGTGTSVSISGLTNGTNYTYTVFTRNGDSWSAGVEVDCTPSIVYCDAAALNSGDEYIGNVEFNTLNNSSGSSTYSDFSSLSTNVDIGSSYNLNITLGVGYPEDSTLVWIDWNADGVFDASEKVLDGTGTASTMSVLVPSGATVGSTRMRIRMYFESPTAANNNNTPCGDHNYGEVEDYTINIIQPCTPTHTFTSMLPTSGPEETEITVTGTGFTASTTASFGAVSATVDFVDATTLIIHVPTGAATDVITLTEAACTVETGTFTLVEAAGPCVSAIGSFTDLIISEVYDANGGSLGYIEIFNGTGATIDLTNYSILRYGDIADTSPTGNPYDFPTSGVGSSIASGAVLVGKTSITAGGFSDFTFINNTGGFNAGDKFELLNGATVIDVLHDVNNDVGYSYKRKETVTTGNTTFTIAEWDYLSTESTTDLGSYTPNPATSPPTITSVTDASDCFNLDYSVTATAGNSGALTYKWFYNDAVNDVWTEVTTTVPTGYTILGEAGNNLLIEGDVNPLSDLANYQFYCEVTEDASCTAVSNAEKFVFENDRYFRSAATGNWDDAANWEMSTTGATWTAACVYPTATNSDSISIDAGKNITLNIDLAADQIIVQSGATLFLDQKLTVPNGNTTGEDLEVIGTLHDQANSINSVSFTNGGTWKLAANGTIIKTNTSSAVTYRDNYETGISNIPATADWIYRQDGTATSVSVASSANGKPMFYPNLSFESTSGNHDFSSLTEIFTGYYEKITIKGDLNIGVSGNDVTVINNNFNTDEALIEGDLYIAAGSELTNETYRSFESNAESGSYNSTYREGAGFELKGDALIEGVLDLAHFSSSLINPSGAKLSGGEGIVFTKTSSMQLVIGDNAESFITHNATINTLLNVELTDIDMVVNKRLIFSNGKVITDVSTSDMVFVTNKSNSAIIGGIAQSSTTRYVEGKLQWTTNGSLTYTFPIGEATQKAQGFTISVTGDDGSNILAFLSSNTGANEMAPTEDYAYCDVETSTATGQQVGQGTAGQDGVLDQIEFNLASPLKWEITNPSGGTISQYDLTVLATGTQDISPVQSADGTTDMRYLLKNGLAYNGSVAAGNTNGAPTFSVTGFDACPNQYALTGMTSFSSFTLNGATAANTTLPVEFLYFNAENKDKDVLVSWATVTEINNDFFIVERSQNGVDFEVITKVAGAGNSNETLAYSFLDKNPLNGMAYYRLKQTDFDGSFEYSEIAIVNRSTISFENANLYPNPVLNELYFSFNSESEKIYSIEIFDVLGKVVYQNINVTFEEGFILRIDVTSLSSGSYMFKARTEKNIISKLFIKK